MRSAFALSLAALAGVALAAPAYQVAQDVDVVIEKVVHTVYVTEGSPEATPCESTSSPAATPYAVQSPSPTSSTPAYSPPAYTPAPEYQATPEPVSTTIVTPTPTPSPSPSASPSPSPSSSSGEPSYMGIMNKWRLKLNLKELEYSEMLQANALKTVIDSAGSMKHELNSGSYAQVLAPGKPDDFEHVCVGGWFCEEASKLGIEAECATFSKGWDYEGQTGHAEILTSADYSKLGCANNDGIWACDLA